MQTTVDIIRNLMTEEKERYSAYQQLCTQYQVSPDELVLFRHQGKMEAFGEMLKALKGLDP